jgi:mono/diheme cytochrome c family protein
MKRVAQVAALVSALVFALAAHGARREGKAAQGASFSDAPAAALYNKHCATCHGKDGRAKTLKAKFNKARDLTDAEWQAAVTDERLFNSITRGRGNKMPSFGKKLNAAQVESLVAHVRRLKKE